MVAISSNLITRPELFLDSLKLSLNSLQNLLLEVLLVVSIATLQNSPLIFRNNLSALKMFLLYSG